jgi:hypothetical protein
MVMHSIVLKKELDDIEHLKQLPRLYDFLSNPLIAFIIDYCTITNGRLNMTYVLIVWIVLKVYKLRFQCPQLFLCVIQTPVDATRCWDITLSSC